MKAQSSVVSVGLFLAFGVGCGGTSSSLRKVDATRRMVAGSTIHSANEDSFEGSVGAAQMGVQNEVGVYDGADVDAVLAERMDEVRGCYRKAGRAQRYAGGTVTLRFLVDGHGATEDVLVVGSDLGNYDVERCLVGVGRSVQFPAPHGHRGTSFEYPVEFRSTHELQVQDLDDSLKVERDLASSMRTLASCGPVADEGASAIFYIDPTGAIGSVGIAATSTVDEQAAACTVREIRRWRISATLPGRMLRYHTALPTMVASTEPRRAGQLTVASRRRRSPTAR